MLSNSTNVRCLTSGYEIRFEKRAGCRLQTVICGLYLVFAGVGGIRYCEIDLKTALCEFHLRWQPSQKTVLRRGAKAKEFRSFVTTIFFANFHPRLSNVSPPI